MLCVQGQARMLGPAPMGEGHPRLRAEKAHGARRPCDPHLALSPPAGLPEESALFHGSLLSTCEWGPIIDLKPSELLRIKLHRAQEVILMVQMGVQT